MLCNSRNHLIFDTSRQGRQPTQEIRIPYLHAPPDAGESTDQQIAALLSRPETQPPTGQRWPVVLLISGLDGYRID
jgi:hypothetical protein